MPRAIQVDSRMSKVLCAALGRGFPSLPLALSPLPGYTASAPSHPARRSRPVIAWLSRFWEPILRPAAPRFGACPTQACSCTRAWMLWRGYGPSCRRSSTPTSRAGIVPSTRAAPPAMTTSGWIKWRRWCATAAIRASTRWNTRWITTPTPNSSARTNGCWGAGGIEDQRKKDRAGRNLLLA